jgi:hypothetical protein
MKVALAVFLSCGLSSSLFAQQQAGMSVGAYDARNIKEFTKRDQDEVHGRLAF